ncbi:MAG: orotidine-5'-phosphate decarboxylase [Clostridia bacterium]|nr:orotidine-5'-phosphate decarboxylase [Clostridia bacterium]
MIMDKLYRNALDKSPVCVGLDTRYGYLPQYLKDGDMSLEDKLLEFNTRIIDATADIAGCFKVQIACYEALGLAGLRAFARTVAYARGKGAVVISDVKRGDISSTAAEYAQGHFTGDFETDIMTVNAYMGEDAVSPYYPYLERGKGLFVLVKTSNASSVDFQDKRTEAGALYEEVASAVSRWGAPYIGESGYSAIGAVVGCTYPEQFDVIRKLMPNTFFLIPGYGAQGGTGKDIAQFFRHGICGVVNSSRGIITAHKGKAEGADFAEHARAAVVRMKEDIAAWL